LERTVTVRTPESIAFYYELAGLGSRFLALACDMVLQLTAMLGVILLLAATAPRVSALVAHLRIHPRQIEAVYVSIIVTFAFLLGFGYFIAFEAWWNGQTPGKKLMGIRVVRDGGYPIDFTASLLRNLVRLIEAAFFYTVSAISMVLSSENKRLGDLAAGTIVVRDSAFSVTDPGKWLSGDAAAPQQPAVSGADALTPDEFALVQRYVDRRTLLPRGVADDTAARIAGNLRPKLGADAQRLSDDELLLRIAASRK